MIGWIILMFVGVTGGKVVLWLMLMTGFGLPQPVWWIKILLSIAMVVALAGAIGLITLSFLAADGEAMRENGVWLLAIYFTGHMATWWLLVAHAMHCHFHSKGCNY